MRARTTIAIAAAALVLLLTVPAVREAQAVSCHCFRDREFDAGRPASADPYVLATTRNSLVAAAMGVDKGSIVKQRMKGAGETDIWLYGYLPGRLGVDGGALATAVKSRGSWPSALQSLGRDPTALGKGFAAAVEMDDPDAMAGVLADGVIVRSFRVSPEVLAGLHGAGANIAEAALSVLIAGRSGQPADAVYGKVKSGKDTWGSILYSLGVPLDQVGDIVMGQVKRLDP